MARIAGVELPNDKKVDYALTRLYGVGWSRSKKILEKANIDFKKRVQDLTDEEIAKIARELEVAPIEGDLHRRIKENIDRLVAIGSYRGLRYTKGLPVRGQRTKTNARTKRGKRRTVGAFKKEIRAKMQRQEGRESR